MCQALLEAGDTTDFSGRGEKEISALQGAGRVPNGRHWLWVSNTHIEGGWGLLATIISVVACDFSGLGLRRPSPGAPCWSYEDLVRG